MAAGVGLAGPEDRKVLEHLLGLVKVGDQAGRARGQLGVDCLAAGHVLGAREVAQLVEVAGTAQALFQCRAPLGSLSGAVVAGDELASDRGALHLALAALAAGETAQQVALGGSAGLQQMF